MLGERCKAKLQEPGGGGGGGEEGWNQSVLSDFLFFVFSRITNSVCFTQWPPASQEEPAPTNAVRKNTQLAPRTSRENKMLEMEERKLRRKSGKSMQL